MKRFHVHLNVNDLDASIRYYTQLFAVEPTVSKTDYAKWMLDDPRINFAISTRGAAAGIDHLGIQTETIAEFDDIGRRLAEADAIALREIATTCCYARSDKTWAADPQGLRWEVFRTLEKPPRIPNPSKRAPAADPPSRLPRTKSRQHEPAAAQPRPYLKPRPAAPASGAAMSTETPVHVLFLCTGNSARSILAEALLATLGGERFRAFSAGSFPSGTVQPLAAELATRLGYAAGNMRSKSWDEYAGPGSPHMDLIITVCDNAAGEVCPVWPGQPVSAHWGVADPAAIEGDEDTRRAAYRDAFVTLRRRVELLVALPLEKLDALARERELRLIGRRQA